MLEVVILSMTYPIKYVFQIKQKNLSMFNMITGINESKTLRRHISCEVNVNLVKENVIQINGGITINVDVSVKNM